MKEHIERLRKLAESVKSAANPLALAEAISEGLTATADALETPCTDCGNAQGAALNPPPVV